MSRPFAAPAGEPGFSAKRRGELARLTLARCPDDAAAKAFHCAHGVGMRFIGRALSKRPLDPDRHMALCAALGVCPVRLVRLDLLARPLPPLLGPVEWRCLAFGLVLKRELGGLSVRAAAELARVSPATFNRAERGSKESPRSFDTLVRLAGLLAMHPHELTAPAAPRPMRRAARADDVPRGTSNETR